MKKLEDLPICRDENELKCYINITNEIKYALSKQLKPCTKLQYKCESTLWPVRKNEAIVDIRFPTPPIVKTKQEYLIYDLVSMINWWDYGTLYWFLIQRVLKLNFKLS